MWQLYIITTRFTLVSSRIPIPQYKLHHTNNWLPQKYTFSLCPHSTHLMVNAQISIALSYRLDTWLCVGVDAVFLCYSIKRSARCWSSRITIFCPTNTKHTWSYERIVSRAIYIILYCDHHHCSHLDITYSKHLCLKQFHIRRSSIVMQYANQVNICSGQVVNHVCANYICWMD